MFENHLPDRTAIEVEVEGERQACVGSARKAAG
jgi:hypothetical protein